MQLSNDVMSRVEEGMRVLDARGEEVGKVQLVHMGDPEAVTLDGNRDRPTDLMGRVAEAVLPDEREPDVPEPLRTNLLRTGYVKIDGPGLRDTDRYASSEQVREVNGDTVRLSVARKQLPVEE
jgi:hypothetical protein